MWPAWTELVKFGSTLAEPYSPNRSKPLEVVKTSHGRSRRTWRNSSQFWSNSDQIRPTSPNIGQCFTRFAPNMTRPADWPTDVRRRDDHRRVHRANAPTPWEGEDLLEGPLEVHGRRLASQGEELRVGGLHAGLQPPAPHEGAPALCKHGEREGRKVRVLASCWPTLRGYKPDFGAHSRSSVETEVVKRGAGRQERPPDLTPLRRPP